MVKVSKFDVADYLSDPKTIAAYLTEAFATQDHALIMAALSDVARAKGVTSVAKAAGLARESLYKSLSGNTQPEFETVRKVIGSFGLRMVVEPDEESKVA